MLRRHSAPDKLSQHSRWLWPSFVTTAVEPPRRYQQVQPSLLRKRSFAANAVHSETLRR